MKFDMLRTSDRNAGRTGPDARHSPPCQGAIWNEKENRWEKEISTLEQLFDLMDEVKCRILINAPTIEESECGDLAIIELQDEDER